MTLTLADLRDSDIQNERHTAEFVLGFSALEFDDLGEHMLSLNAKVNGGEENATDESFRIFNDIIVPSLTEEIISKVMNNDEEILVYSGNYDSKIFLLVKKLTKPLCFLYSAISDGTVSPLIRMNSPKKALTAPLPLEYNQRNIVKNRNQRF